MKKIVSVTIITALGVLILADSANAAATAGYPCQFYKKRIEYDNQGNAITKWDPQGAHLHTDGHNSGLPTGVQCFGICDDKSCVCDADQDNMTQDNGPFQKPTRFTSHDCACDTVAPPGPSSTLEHAPSEFSLSEGEF